MSCKAAIYTLNNTTQAVAAGGTIALGTIVRRFGNTPRCCNPTINLSGNGIVISEPGYYKVNVDVTDAATAAGAVTVSLLQDGNVVESLTDTAAAANDAVTISMTAPIVRVIGCTTSTLTVVLTAGAGNVSPVGVSVVKL